MHNGKFIKLGVRFFNFFRNLLYQIIKLPRIYYDNSDYIKIYKSKRNNKIKIYNIYSSQSFSNIDLYELIRRKFKY